MGYRDLTDDQKRILRILDSVKDKRITGRIKLQKIIYLIQQYTECKGFKSFNYKFRFYNFGPFDKSVGIDVTNLSNDTNFFKEIEPQKSEEPWEYKLTNDFIDVVVPDSIELFNINSDELDEKINELNIKDYRLLELTATIVYINNNKIASSKENIEKLSERLKPHLIKRYFEEAYKLANEFFTNAA